VKLCFDCLRMCLCDLCLVCFCITEVKMLMKASIEIENKGGKEEIKYKASLHEFLPAFLH